MMKNLLYLLAAFATAILMAALLPDLVPTASATATTEQPSAHAKGGNAAVAPRQCA